MMELHNAGAQILKLACDAIYFVMPADQEPNIDFSESFGCYKSIYPGTIESFVQTGVNSYSLLYRTEDGQLHSVVKSSGLTLDNIMTNSLMTHELFDQQVENLFQSTIQVDNVRTKRDIKKLKVENTLRKQSCFSKNLFGRRSMSADFHQSYALVAYGYRPPS